jgi:geranylgeranyl diphosphate synthase, type I
MAASLTVDTTEQLSGRVDAALSGFLASRNPAWAADAGSHLYEAVKTFVVRGGKRLRPAFCYWGWRGAGGDDCDAIVTAAAALELLHAFALIHDDVMDRSETRRGTPTLHRQLAALHTREGWRGDSDHFGVSVAVLAGDLCLAWADEMLLGCGLPPARLQAAYQAYSRMRTELMVGQYLDLKTSAVPGAGTPTTSRAAQTARVIRLKTVLYTVVRPMQIGALLAGGTSSLTRGYASFGEPVGEAFQLRDDVLGVFGDPAVTGKSILDDLREGKRTMLVTLAEDLADAAQQTTLARLVGRAALDQKDAAAVRQIIDGTGARQRVEELIARRYAEACARLDRLPIPESARASLAALTRAAAFRDR